MMFGCGLYANIKDSTLLVQFIGWISPYRYATEMMVRTLLSGLPFVDPICDELSFTFKTWAWVITFFFNAAFFFLAWLVIVLMGRKF